MTAHPRLRDVRRFAGIRAPWCVTLYGEAASWLRGNHATGTAQGQLRSVAQALQEADAPPDVIDAIREHLQGLATPHGEPSQIDRHAQSVGIFATEQSAEVFALANAPTPWVGVSDRFLVGPLLEGALERTPCVCVLALSENEVRLIEVTVHPAQVVEVPDLPEDMTSTLALDVTGDRNTLARLRVSDDPKGRLREYARAIDDAVEPVLRGLRAVLVIAATEPLASIYRAMSSHSPVASSTIVGNHDGDSLSEIADLAAPAIEHHRREVLEAQLARFAEMPARGLILTGIDEIAEAASEGAIDMLLVDMDRRIPGPDGEGANPLDQVDEIVRDAMNSDATIVPVKPSDLPTTDPVAAVLRYARVRPPAGREG